MNKTLVAYFSAEHGTTRALAEKLALFATSGGSDIGKTAEKLQPFLKGDASIADAQVFNNDPSAADLKAWVESL